MMNYEEFKKEVTEKFIDYMPEEYKGMKADIISVNKVNVKKDGLILREEGKSNVSPTIYIDGMYSDYKKTDNFDAVMQENAEIMADSILNAASIINSFNYDNARDNIVFELINTEQNKEMLADMPHRKFHDLSIIYKWVLKIDTAGVQGIKINNWLANKLGFDETQLFKIATENTRKIFPPVTVSMNDIIREMLVSDGMPLEISDMMVGEIPDDQMMWVITNEKKTSGAASMLYEDKLHELAIKLGSDLYIMPSSIHEVIAVSTDFLKNPNDLAQLVTEVNMTQVSLDERLSNQVYHYDKDLRKLTLATDTPSKSLDNREIRNSDKEQAAKKIIYTGGSAR